MIDSILDDYRIQINAALERHFARWEERAAVVHPTAVDMVRVIRDFTRGPGKRLRPILMIIGHRLAGGEDGEAIVNAACALELTQSFLLIHDDIMDRSELRRGQPTVHRRYATRFAGQAADADFLGESLAILAGDLANQFAVELLAASAFPAERRTRALAFYAQITADVCYGQLLDVLSGHWGVITCSMADILTIHRYKTARYTTEGPLHLGAVLAGGDEALLSALSMVAVPLGTAFQVQDDLLGMFGDEAITGKATDSDIREGKQTLLVLTALERATPAQQATLRAILGNTQATEEDIATVREIIESTGSRSFCADLVSNLLDEAEAAVSRVPATPEARELLHAVIHHVRGRQR